MSPHPKLLAVAEACPACGSLLICRYEPRSRVVVLTCSTAPLCVYRERVDDRVQRLAQRVRELESRLAQVACAQVGVREEGTM